MGTYHATIRWARGSDEFLRQKYFEQGRCAAHAM